MKRIQPPRIETEIKAGEKIDALGGFTVYGLIARAEVARAENMIPVGLVVGATIVKPVKAGEPIRASDLSLEESQTIVRLRREQDRLLSQN